jgi:hypothetical protein
MSTEDRQDLLANVGTERRDFLKKIAIAAAFATPTIATFSLDGMRKKAFAQAAYDAPTVVDLEPGASDGQAVVTFSQRMDTSNTGDRSRGIGPCRSTAFDGEYFPHEWEWDPDHMKQIITFTGFCTYKYLQVTYNWDPCGNDIKFRGENGLELVPWSGELGVNGPGPC